jgi:hypothetical protein
VLILTGPSSSPGRLKIGLCDNLTGSEFHPVGPGGFCAGSKAATPLLALRSGMRGSVHPQCSIS